MQSPLLETRGRPARGRLYVLLHECIKLYLHYFIRLYDILLQCREARKGRLKIIYPALPAYAAIKKKYYFFNIQNCHAKLVISQNVKIYIFLGGKESGFIQRLASVSHRFLTFFRTQWSLKLRHARFHGLIVLILTSIQIIWLKGNCWEDNRLELFYEWKSINCERLKQSWNSTC